MVLGPAEAPLALVRGRYRFRLLVKTERNVDMQPICAPGSPAARRCAATSRSRSMSTRRAFL